jgi:hypothetical protein
MAMIIMSIVMIHLVVGFGWMIYKLEFEPKKKVTK